MWRQNVASFQEFHVASQDVASKCGVTCPRGGRQPGGIAGAAPGFTPMASFTWRQNVVACSRGVAGRGVKTCRHAPWTCAASQDVSSIPGVRRPRPPGPGKCLQNVSSVVGRYAHLHRRPACNLFLPRQLLLLLLLLLYKLLLLLLQ